MKPTIKSIRFLMLFISTIAVAQMQQYDTKSELEGIAERWHTISLPNAVFETVDNSLSGIRIFGITDDQKTIEVPFLLRRSTEEVENTAIEFRKINETNNQNGFYTTFEIPSEATINHIQLDFAQKNFDWKLTLEGSQNNSEWFTITENYRIVSVSNSLSNYQFTKVIFPDAKYRYYRYLIDSKEKPNLLSAKLEQRITKQAGYNKFSVSSFSTSNNTETKKTTLKASLNSRLPVSNITIDVVADYDYYRPITIKYLTDSIQSEQGWKYNYRTLTTGTLSSIEENSFTFKSTLAQKMQIIIENQDNEPLTIKSVAVNGYKHELVARFTEPATYFLVYGTKNPKRPNYDIVQFENNIPENLKSLKVLSPQLIEKEVVAGTKPLFENKAWLWAIMGIIILVLGWFSIKMIRQ